MDNSYFARRVGSGSQYNYELTPLITDFTFYDFVNEGVKERKFTRSWRLFNHY